MSRLVFLLEEYSMKVFLDGLLPRFFPGLPFLCVPHEGKQDLEKSIPRKLNAWREPGVRFIVIRDNDGGNCRELKRRLVGLCRAGHNAEALVRVACQELEAWYLGDPGALADEFGDERLRELGARERYRDPDAVVEPANAVGDLVPEFQKVSGARRMASRLRRDSNSSRSFHALIEGIEREAASVGVVPAHGKG